MTDRSPGFTVVELVVVVAILGIVANIAIPSVVMVKRKADATAVVGDYLAIRQAAYEYFRDTSEFPSDYYPGGEPRELRPYLEGRVRWTRDDLKVRYDWENWVRADGSPKHRSTGVLYGVSITTTNQALVETIPLVYDGPFKYTLNRNYTFVLEPIGP